jgi:hypothetical protein
MVVVSDTPMLLLRYGAVAWALRWKSLQLGSIAEDIPAKRFDFDRGALVADG